MNGKLISPQDSEEVLEQNAEISLELIKEKEFQKRIAESDYIKKSIADVLLEDYESYTLSYGKEVEFINGITSDFIIYEDNKKEILATIECKRPDIGVTEYVRGIGQLYQYQYFADKGIKPRKYTQYNYPKSIDKHKVITALIIPSEFYKNTNLDISTFNYPDSTVLVEVNMNNNNVRVINEKILRSVSKQNTNTISISPYYFRDNRIFEIYLLLRYLALKQSLYVSKVDRKQSEQELRQINTINNGNWRNAYITLSDLGFINSDNLPTAVGITMSSYTLEQFTRVLYQDYFKNYIDVIVDVFQKYPEVLKKSNIDIVKKIKEEYNGKDVLYLTESDGRYISSWLSIMRDDLGCLNYESRSSNRTLVYDPASLKDKPLEDAIKANDEGKKYEDKYTELVRQGRIR